MQPPFVSIIVPTYNHEQYLAECLDAILAQTFTNYEVIIVNDCSTDKTQEIADTYANKHPKKIRCIHNPVNIGVSRVWFKGFRVARGKYFIPTAGDDILMPEAIATHVKMLEENPTASASVGNGIWFNSETGEELRHHYLEEEHPVDLSYNALMFRQCIFAPSAMLRMSALQGLDHLEGLWHMEWPLFAELLQKGEAVYTNCPVLYYRRHDNNLSNDLDHMWTSIFEALYYMKHKIKSPPEINLSLSKYHRLYGKFLKKKKKQPLYAYKHYAYSGYYKALYKTQKQLKKYCV